MSELVVGVVGGGQLGRMLVEESPGNLDFVAVENDQNCPISQEGAAVIVGSITDPDKIRRLAALADVTTIEVEHVAADTLVELAEEGHDVQPDPRSLIVIKDKLTQKMHYETHKLPTPPFLPIDSAEDLEHAKLLFRKIIIKSRTNGFDGRGNLNYSDQSWDEVYSHFTEKFGLKIKLLAEKIVPFQKELAVLVARDRVGQLAVYPVVETIHVQNQCHTVLSPAPIDPKIRAEAEELGRETVATFDGAGVYAVEMFLDEDDNVLINEVAPRVHNSGHLTIEAHTTSQFRQHLLAITGQPLGNTEQKSPAAVMINILGDRNGPANLSGKEAAEALTNTKVHVYGKADTKKARKMGHITTIGLNLDEVRQIAERARSLVTI